MEEWVTWWLDNRIALRTGGVSGRGAPESSPALGFLKRQKGHVCLRVNVSETAHGLQGVGGQVKQTHVRSEEEEEGERVAAAPGGLPCGGRLNPEVLQYGKINL